MWSVEQFSVAISKIIQNNFFCGLVRRPAQKMLGFCLLHGHFTVYQGDDNNSYKKSASFNSQFEHQYLASLI